MVKKAAKPVAAPKPSGKAAVKPVVKTPAKPASKDSSAKTAAAPKAKKAKLVRDSFTIPKAEYVVLDALKQRAGKLTRSVKKSELLRAGIKVLASLSDAAFLTALGNVPAVKTGRPSMKK
ncbi:MAG: hypothetical protein Q7T87_17595 [Polaromonas sp.]|nr:hypothetical protein [Polaromonas sp.]